MLNENKMYWNSCLFFKLSGYPLQWRMFCRLSITCSLQLFLWDRKLFSLCYTWRFWLHYIRPINKPFIKQCILILLFSQISFQLKQAWVCVVWPHMLMKSKNLLHERWIRVLCCKWSVKHMWMMLRRWRGKEEREKGHVEAKSRHTHTHTQNVIEQAHNNNSHKLWSSRLHFLIIDKYKCIF